MHSSRHYIITLIPDWLTHTFGDHWSEISMGPHPWKHSSPLMQSSHTVKLTPAKSSHVPMTNRPYRASG